MPTRQINLLPRDDFEKKPIGKFLNWALTVGRWIVIFTELLVILAFLSRFKLDADLADLHDSIKEKQAIVAASSSFEQNFRLVQKRLSVIQSLEKGQLDTDKLFNEISRLMPLEVALRRIVFSNQDYRITITGSSTSEKAIGLFLNGLSRSALFKDVAVTSVAKNSGLPGVNFSLTATLVI